MPLAEPKTTSQVRERHNSQKSTKSPREEDICTPQKLTENEAKKSDKSENLELLPDLDPS
jgi:hypothetical protein